MKFFRMHAEKSNDFVDFMQFYMQIEDFTLRFEFKKTCKT